MVTHTPIFWGKKYLGMFLMGLGFFITSPPFSGIPDDFLNVFIADKILVPMGLSFHVGLLISYVLLGPIIFFLGAFIYPHGTMQLINGFKNKIVRMIGMLRNPKYLLLAIIGILITMYIYFTYLQSVF